MRVLHVLLRLEGPDKPHDLYSPAVLGVMESILYPTVLIAGHFEFIGLWVALKVAGQWIRWRGEPPRALGAIDDKKRVEEMNEGRRRFNRFLVGNALAIMLAGATYGAVRAWVLY
jgi:hypothetical protein